MTRKRMESGQPAANEAAADEKAATRFAGQLSRELESELEQLPEAVTRRLAQSRRRAVAVAETTMPRWRSGPLPVALGSAAVLALAVVIGLNGGPDVPPLPVSSEPEFAAAQDLEVLEQLEFLAWLEEEHPDAG